MVNLQTLPQRAIEPPPSFHEAEVVRASLKGYAANNFAKFLISLFAEDLAMKLIQTYWIGTAKGGRTVFWQLDKSGKARAGKIIQYDASTGKRSKTENPNWVHSLMKLEDYHLKQCLFGSHLMSSRPNDCHVAIVEAEKTAVLASAFLPDFLWLATGGSNGPGLTSPETLAMLKGRKVVLFPDTGSFDKWSQKAAEMRVMGVVAQASGILENKERPGNWDLADELLSYRQPLTLEDGRTFNWALTEPDGHPLFWDQK